MFSLALISATSNLGNLVRQGGLDASRCRVVVGRAQPYQLSARSLPGRKFSDKAYRLVGCHPHDSSRLQESVIVGVDSNGVDRPGVVCEGDRGVVQDARNAREPRELAEQPSRVL